MNRDPDDWDIRDTSGGGGGGLRAQILLAAVLLSACGARVVVPIPGTPCTITADGTTTTLTPLTPGASVNCATPTSPQAPTATSVPSTPTAAVVTPVPQPTATVGAPVPSQPTMVPVSGNCSGPHSDPPNPGVTPALASVVTTAQSLVKSQHPDWFVGNKVPLPSNWAPYAFSVCDNLRGAGYDCVVDICNCGQIAVAPAGSTAYSEDYAVLVSDGTVRTATSGFFADRCVPRAFPVVASTTPAPSPTSAPVAACPPPITFAVSTRPETDCPAGKCAIVDVTPLFPVSGCSNSHGGVGCPCNAEHPTCGAALGDSCEPAPTFVDIATASMSGPATATGDYLGSVRGPAGSSYQVTVTLLPNARTKGGAPVGPMPTVHVGGVL